MDTATLRARMHRMTRSEIQRVLKTWHKRPECPNFMIDFWIEESQLKSVTKDRLNKIVSELHQITQGPVSWADSSDSDSDTERDRTWRK